jgi:hypothetical protein
MGRVHDAIGTAANPISCLFFEGVVRVEKQNLRYKLATCWYTQVLNSLPLGNAPLGPVSVLGPTTFWFLARTVPLSPVHRKILATASPRVSCSDGTNCGLRMKPRGWLHCAANPLAAKRSQAELMQQARAAQGAAF